MTEHDIKVGNTPLTVKGLYIKEVKSTHLTPYEPQEFEIFRVYAGGVDITNLLENDLEDFEKLVITQNY